MNDSPPFQTDSLITDSTPAGIDAAQLTAVGSSCCSSDVLAIRARHPDVPAAQADPLYAMPRELIDEIRVALPGWLSAQEMAFERDLAAFCASCDAVGIVDGLQACSWTLARPRRFPISRALFEEMRWEQVISYGELTGVLSLADQVCDPLREQGEAYVGWLLTNSQFLAERDELRQSRRSTFGWRSCNFQDAVDPTLRRFLDRWMLSGMASWELPIPQGPNLTGGRWPSHITAGQTMIPIDYPLTMTLPARLPLGRVLGGIRGSLMPPHLSEWHEVLGRSSAAGFAMLFRLHFYRNLVLASHYAADRIAGNSQALDCAFGGFLGRSEDSVKKTRLLITHRLTRPAPAGTSALHG